MGKKIIILMIILFGIGLIQNPNNLYVGTEVKMIAIDKNHLKNQSGEVYLVEGELNIGEAYIVTIQVHPDQTYISSYREEEQN